MRGQSFAGEALGDIGTTGGSAAFLVGVGPLWGFVGVGVAAAAAMELIGIQRPRGRDLATGHRARRRPRPRGAAAVPGHDAAQHDRRDRHDPVRLGVRDRRPRRSRWSRCWARSALAIVALLYRPLLLSSVSAEMAAARGIPVRALGAAYLLALAVAVALAAITIGTILSTALLVGPAATALRLTRRPGVAIARPPRSGSWRCGWAILLAYDSYYWPPAGTAGR